VAVALIPFRMESALAQKKTPEGERIAAVFKRLRTNAGLTQEEVARRVDLTLSGYRTYEQGKRQFRYEQTDLFAQAFGVKPHVLARELGITRPPGESDAEALRIEAARDLAALAASELADLLSQLEGLEPAEWRDVIDTWRAQASNPRIVPQRD